MLYSRARSTEFSLKEGPGGRYFFIKFGDGVVDGTNRYSTNNPSYWYEDPRFFSIGVEKG